MYSMINAVTNFVMKLIMRTDMKILFFFGVCVQSDVIRKPQGQIELNSSCSIVRGEGAQTFQVSGEHVLKFVTQDPNSASLCF